MVSDTPRSRTLTAIRCPCSVPTGGQLESACGCCGEIASAQASCTCIPCSASGRLKPMLGMHDPRTLTRSENVSGKKTLTPALVASTESCKERLNC